MHSALSMLFLRKQMGVANLHITDEFIPIQAAARLSHTLPEASNVINNILTSVVSTVGALKGGETTQFRGYVMQCRVLILSDPRSLWRAL